MVHVLALNEGSSAVLWDVRLISQHPGSAFRVSRNVVLSSMRPAARRLGRQATTSSYARRVNYVQPPRDGSRNYVL